MTIHRDEEHHCPACGAGNRVQVWSSVNAHVNPEAEAALLCGQINGCRCQRCGEQFSIQQSLLYHDMESRFMAWYFSSGSIESGEIFNAITPNGQARGTEHLPELDYAGHIHYVFDMDELVRYIKFRDLLATEDVPPAISG